MCARFRRSDVDPGSVALAALQSLSDPPWGKHDGEVIEVDGAVGSVIEPEDVVAIYALWTDSLRDEECALVALLDGRLVAWETTWDVTGSGFHYDAYGGGAPLVFGYTVEGVLARIGEANRERLLEQYKNTAVRR